MNFWLKISILFLGVLNIISLIGLGLYQYEDYKRGYTRGKVVLILDVSKEIDLKVNDKTKTKNHSYFMSIKDIDLYIYNTKALKTIAIYNYFYKGKK